MLSCVSLPDRVVVNWIQTQCDILHMKVGSDESLRLYK